MDKNKQYMTEAIVGMVVLIALIVFAVWLLIRRENNTDKATEVYPTEAVEETADNTEDIREATDNAGSSNTSNTAGIDLTKQNRDKKAGNDGKAAELSQVYTPGEPMEWTLDEYQLPELYACWDAYELDAVTDLIQLERVRKISATLKDSDNYYYYGESDRSGNPDGKGLAVYADDTYYFGEWKSGKRAGEGMWVRVFVDEPGTVNGITGVTWHQYSGQWSDDYPNGQGQENIRYDADSTDAGYEDFAIQNAIGGFKNGMYNGEMYIMTNIGGGSTIDWYGTAKEGVFSYIGDKKGYMGKRAIWRAGDGYETGEEDNCRWILPADNADYGIAGLKRS